MSFTSVSGLGLLWLLTSFNGANANEANHELPFYVPVSGGKSCSREQQLGYPDGTNQFYGVEDGKVYQIAVGTGVLDSFRAELELTYRRNDVEPEFRSFKGRSFDVESDVRSISFMANLAYDHEFTGTFSAFLCRRGTGQS